MKTSAPATAKSPPRQKTPARPPAPLPEGRSSNRGAPARPSKNPLESRPDAGLGVTQSRRDLSAREERQWKEQEARAVSTGIPDTVLEAEPAPRAGGPRAPAGPGATALVQIGAPEPTGLVPAELESLDEDARDFMEAAASPATRLAYRSDWKQFSAWCRANRFGSMPAETATLVRYVTHLANAGKKVSTIERARAAISVAHDTAHERNPSHTPEVKRAMKGIRRTLGVAKKGKTPLLMADMLEMLAVVDTKTVAGRRDRAILAIGFTGAFRRSELVAIEIEQLTFEEEGVVVFVPRSKTDQEGEGRHVGIPYAPPDASTCPVLALETWLATLKNAGIVSGPIFRRVNKGKYVGDYGLTDMVVATIVKKHALAAGKDPKQFAGHSLRSGFATQSVMDDVPEAEIMRQTGHKSVTVFRSYVRRASVFQKNAAKGVWK